MLFSETWKNKNSIFDKLNDSAESKKSITDPLSGIRIINPLISSQELTLLIGNKKLIKMSCLKSHLAKQTESDDDWVTMGVLVSKMSKKSQNGNDYSLWKLSDLKTEQCASLFLFGKVNEQHWKLPVGAVVALLNCTVMSDSKGKSFQKNKNEICSLTIDHGDKLLLLGTSKDLGYCKATKKDGQVCGNMISKAEDEYCLYHIKSAYRKFSSNRAELQTTFSNKEPEELHFSNNYMSSAETNKRNIVLETKCMNSKQMKTKREIEQQHLKKVLQNPLSKAAQNLAAMKMAEKEKGKRPVAKVATPSTPQISAKAVLEQIKTTPSQPAPPRLNQSVPALARGIKRGHSIEFNLSARDMQMSAAKRRAIELLKNKPITTSKLVTPTNSVERTRKNRMQDLLKRVDSNLSQSNDDFKKEQDALIKAALNRRSINHSAVEDIENEQQEVYFNKLEKKERYEERLAEVKEIRSKVVTCTECNYTAPSQSDLCKSRNHQVSFHQGKKKFFSCKKCKTRTTTLDDMMPTKACITCGSTSYEKASIINVIL